MVAMTRAMTDAPVPLADYVPRADRFVVMRVGKWEAYAALLGHRGERSRPRMAYLDGALQLMSPSTDHERIRRALGHFVFAYCESKRIDCTPTGSWTHSDESEEAGLEPDESFLFGDDPAGRPHADLAIEVIWTSGGLEKLEIYRRLRVPEVWFWEDDAISVHVLGAEGYVRAERSTCLPDLDLALVCRLVPVQPLSAAVQQLREALRG